MKAELNARLAQPLTASKLKKTKIADLQAMLNAQSDAYHDAMQQGAFQALAEELTEKECKVVLSFLSCSAYDTCEEVLADNATWSDVGDVAKDTGMTQKTVKGVIGSLTKRGLIEVEDAPNGAPGTIQCLTDDGARVAFECAAVEAEKAPKKAPAKRATTAAFTSGEPQPVRDGTKRAEILRALAKIAKICVKANGEPWAKTSISAACQRFWLSRGIVIERNGEVFKLSAQHNLKDLIA